MKLATKICKSYIVNYDEPVECLKVFNKVIRNNTNVTIRNFKRLNYKTAMLQLSIGIASGVLAYYIGKCREEIAQLQEEHRIYNELNEELMTRINALEVNALK